jgi:ankyrin repeat protein
LLTILPQIMEGAPIDTTISNANGTTALHNACGLSHVGIVRWLVEHGADLNAKAAKGAGVDDCVGGPNAKAIRAILRKARNNR